MDLHPIAIVIGDIVVILGGVALMLRPFRKRIAKLVANREAQADDIAAIKAEVLPNHGSSLRDAVDRLEGGQARLEEGQAHMKEEIAKQSDRMDDHIAAHFRA